jgi:hypothetical protein
MVDRRPQAALRVMRSTPLRNQNHGEEMTDAEHFAAIIKRADHIKPTEQPLVGVISQLRRLYHHAINGGTVTANDLSRIIARLENITNADA